MEYMTDKQNGLPEIKDFSEEDRQFMQMAIDLSVANIDDGGGPFGAVIVRGGQLIAAGANRVVPNNDPTAHAEVVAIRNACKELKIFDLSGCTVYTSCEPCPMCLSALYWAGIKRICYANTKRDAAAIDFDDNIGDWKLLRLQQHLPLHKTIQTAIPNHSRSYEKAVEGEVIGRSNVGLRRIADGKLTDSNVA